MAAAPEAMGATVGADATWFSVTSSVAERVELCLFDTDDRETDRIDLAPVGDGRWTVRVAGVGDGQRYGYRVHGPGDPANGHACDPSKLLVDPAARRVMGELRWARELTTPGVDSAGLVPRSVVVAPPGLPVAPVATRRSWADQVVYEAHVGHLTARHPLVPIDARGSYRGLAAPVVVDHLLRLGVTAVELLPVQHFVSEAALVAGGRRNVWGYNPLAWGAPHNAYATPGGDPVAELRSAVTALHEAGLEVWLDVVWNHTCEGGLGSGPILSWRGFDNAATYRLRPGPHGLVDDDLTGCGNTIDFRSEAVRGLVRQLLVRWVEEYGIDGFRFDLAAVALRGDDGPDPHAPLLAELAEEPRLHGVRLVAEPWDIGLGGYALGGFPPPWREWNDRFRDDARALWLGGDPHWSAVATRFTASADVFGGEESVRPASASINAVATHDGFTLADLVTWSAPLDGGHHQGSHNSGGEGPSADPEVLARRRRRQRCLLGWLLCAQGVPMVAAGDELGRTQGGHADGYVLDPVEWGVAWAEADWDLVAWTAEAVRVRGSHHVLRRERRVAPGDPAIGWLGGDGKPVDGDRWHDRAHGALQVVLTPEDDAEAPVLVVLLAEGEEVVRLPAGRWRVLLDARLDRGVPPEPQVWEGSQTVDGPVLVVLAAE